MKRLKKILLALLALFIILQFIRPKKNNSGEVSRDISKVYVVPENVRLVLAKACNDCHSNNTRYPWYAEIQPVGWWLASHVKDGKRHLNFNEFEGYLIARRYKKLEDCIEQVRKGEMPLSSYTLIHKDAVLTAAEKETLYTWCDIIRDSIKADNPPDSLVLKRN